MATPIKYSGPLYCSVNGVLVKLNMTGDGLNAIIEANTTVKQLEAKIEKLTQDRDDLAIGYDKALHTAGKVCDHIQKIGVVVNCPDYTE